MGVTYKLRDDVVHFIINQRQGNPLFSCRQLAESVSQKFGLRLSKSSVHDVLRESGIITPRGRKPKNKFEIPLERKKQIQVSLSQVKLLPAPDQQAVTPLKEEMVVSAVYEGAGKVFVKAALWDLGIFSQENIKALDWDYYLTPAKGIKVFLDNDKNFFIDLPLPIERCIRETADGLINNTAPLIVSKVSDEMLFKACMDAQAGFKMKNIEIVGQNDHILFKIDSIVESKRKFYIQNRIFVENSEKDLTKRYKTIFFSQIIGNNEDIENILNLKGFDSTNGSKNIVTISIEESYKNKTVLQEAADKLNGMYLRDEHNRLVRLEITVNK